MINQSNNTPEDKKNPLKIEDLKPLNNSVCKDLTFDEQSKICGGGIAGTGSFIRYSYR